jgi:bifunctional NMN adenylyltransferase/nudix hydrolase
MSKEFDFLIFIGRMQPPHLGHKKVIEEALQKSNKVIILQGSAGSARTIRNPFTFEERMQMVLSMFSVEDRQRIIIKPIYDKTYNDAAWIKEVQVTIKEAILGSSFNALGYNDLKIGLIGAEKDNTSYYLKLFPQFKSVPVPIHNVLHATGIRESLFNGTFRRWEEQDNILHKNVVDFLEIFKTTPEFKTLQEEFAFIKEYQKQWKAAPYPVKHVTVDAVVEQSGHVLLVKRKSNPGKGKWAIVGGHLNEYEDILEGILRELREETLIKVPEAVLKGSIKDIHVFSDPYRSCLGRVITHAAHIRLTDDVKLPKIKGADDAEKAKWWVRADITEDMMFDDHFHIINYFLGE